LNIREFVKLDACIILCLLMGSVGSYFTAPQLSTWYVHLEKPSFTPPNWVFGPVWISLYILMGAALYLVWGMNDYGDANDALVLFGIQMVLNFLWPVVFFGMRSPLYGLIVIVALLGAIFLTMREFNKFSARATFLLMPYFLWVAFAAVLNFLVWRMN
jgi:tryptophan-rich sensory protein